MTRGPDLPNDPVDGDAHILEDDDTATGDMPDLAICPHCATVIPVERIVGSNPSERDTPLPLDWELTVEQRLSKLEQAMWPMNKPLQTGTHR